MSIAAETGIRVTWDKQVDMGFIYLAPMRIGAVGETIEAHDHAGRHVFNVKVDKGGRLLGIEVFGASKRVPLALLEGAEIIGT